MFAPLTLAAMFMTLGAFDGMLGVAWPTMAEQMNRSIGDLGILLGVYLACSMVGSLSADRIMQRLGLKPAMVAASVIAVMGALLVAIAPDWTLLLAAIVIRGLGNGVIHVCLNTYAGKTLNNRRLMMVHSAWGAGATLAAMSMTYLVTQDLPWQWNLAWCVVPAVVAISLYSRLPQVELERRQQTALPMRRLDWMAVAAAGTYVAVEASVGNWAFTLMTQGWQSSEVLAGSITSSFWALLTLCRLGLSLLPVSAGRWLRIMPIGLMLSPLLIGVGIWTPLLGMAGVILAGVCSSVMFPNIINRGITNADPQNHGKVTGYMLTTAAAGGAGGPALMGVIAGAGALLWIPLPIFLIGIGAAYSARAIATKSSIH